MRGAVLAVALLLVACGPSPEQQKEQAEAFAVPVVTPILAKEYPGATITPFAECVVDNASDEELLKILEAARNGVTGRTTQMVLGMARRPEVRTCAFDAGVRGLV